MALYNAVPADEAPAISNDSADYNVRDVLFHVFQCSIDFAWPYHDQIASSQIANRISFEYRWLNAKRT